MTPAEKSQIMQNLGTTLKSYDYTEYLLLKIAELAEKKSWQQVKNKINLESKKQLEELTISMLIENRFLTKCLTEQIENQILITEQIKKGAF